MEFPADGELLEPSKGATSGDTRCGLTLIFRAGTPATTAWGGHVPCHDGAGANRCALADGDSAQDRRARMLVIGEHHAMTDEDFHRRW